MMYIGIQVHTESPAQRKCNFHRKERNLVKLILEHTSVGLPD